MVWDPIITVNLGLCIIIAVLGYLGYKKGRGKVSLYIGIAFGIFGIPHILTLLGLRETLRIFLIITNLLAYLIVIFVLYKKRTALLS